jgi:hypothetical protein
VSRSCRVFSSPFFVSVMSFKNTSYNFHDCAFGEHESSTFGLENQRRPLGTNAGMSEYL